MRDNIRTIIFLTLFSVLTVETLSAADTVRISKPTSFRTLGAQVSGGDFMISNKVIAVPFEGPGRGLLDWIDMRGSAANVRFKGSRLSYWVPKAPLDRPEVTRNTNTLIFDSCSLGITLSKIKGSAVVSNSQIGSLIFDSCKGTNIQIDGNRTIRLLEFLNCKNIGLHMDGNIGIDSFDFRCFDSRLRDFQLFANRNETGTRRYYFVNDTIDLISGGSAGIEDSSFVYRRQGPFRHVLYFERCYINADVSMIYRLFNSCIFFNDCSFGPNANFDDLLVDRVVFYNCRNFNKQLFINWREKNVTAELRIINTDVSSLNIGWSDNVKLFFDSTDSRDLIDNTYEILLAKYQSEGRHDSYRHVELQQLKARQPKLWYAMSGWWWGHGYAQQRVYIWAIVAILVFAVFNYVYWRQMQGVYTVFDNVSYRGSRLRRMIKHSFVVLLYSIFVFFSIHLKLDKLKIGRSAYVVFFLFQYFFGVFTLLFILKAVFKW